ncbi:MAG: hypothetical protein O2841_04320 [Actinomycetota bacterium]|nr:hypothetical protein [Actinomycetota bacterium]
MLNKSFIWVLRILVAILPFIGAGVDELVSERSTSVQNVATVLAWAVWATSVLSVFILHPATLTVLRMAVPVITATLLYISVTGAIDTSQIICAAISVAILLISFNADLGNAFIQASAYGDEKRFLLRPPVALVAPVLLIAMMLLTATVAAPILIAAENLPLGIICSVVSAVGFWFFARRIHQLSRRWFVFVPAGFVVHDETLLGTNLMIRKHDLVEIQLAKRDTQAADLTALTWGVPLELRFKQPQDISLTSLTAKHLKAVSAIHASSILIAPSRPGAVLRAAK